MVMYRLNIENTSIFFKNTLYMEIVLPGLQLFAITNIKIHRIESTSFILYVQYMNEIESEGEV